MKKNLMRRAARKIDSGFTLIEVMIAIVVMAVGLLAVIASFATAIQATQSAEEDLIARQKVLEAVPRLCQAQRETTTLFYINGYSLEQVSAMQEVPLGTVKRRLHDARQNWHEDVRVGRRGAHAGSGWRRQKQLCSECAGGFQREHDRDRTRRQQRQRVHRDVPAGPGSDAEAVFRNVSAERPRPNCRRF